MLDTVLRVNYCEKRCQKGGVLSSAHEAAGAAPGHEDERHNVEEPVLGRGVDDAHDAAHKHPRVAPQDVDALQEPAVARRVFDVFVGYGPLALGLVHGEGAYEATDGHYHEREPEGVVHAQDRCGEGGHEGTDRR